jgi:hypothetical protein
VKGRSANEAWFLTDSGLGVLADFPTDTWVVYTLDPKTHRGKAVVKRNGKVLEEVDMERGVPHNYILAADMDGKDVWIGTSKGLAWAIGPDYYAGLRERTPQSAQAASAPAPVAASSERH